MRKKKLAAPLKDLQKQHRIKRNRYPTRGNLNNDGAHDQQPSKEVSEVINGDNVHRTMLRDNTEVMAARGSQEQDGRVKWVADMKVRWREVNRKYRCACVDWRSGVETLGEQGSECSGLRSVQVVNAHHRERTSQLQITQKLSQLSPPVQS